MKILVEVNDNKAGFLLELLRSFSFVKAKPISETKARVFNEVNEAVEYMSYVKKGKVKAKPARGILDEL
ncbi:MAG: hypothetical protein CVU05_14030 [Bacteroidetes bacterium HGW-Bacteroidetes-21]|jgi:hypothetical protein|nr:MAG: hypothetical protein CVU05_14030 [Bacteroidetes bacterium HGW-Bacteroidetes-21]